jgi:nitrous oxidase accessory protein NosD
LLGKMGPRRLIPLCLGLCMAFAVTAAAGASAATLYVSNSAPVVAGGKSCAQPGYSAIQAAITAGGAGANISICPGTYTEQLAITKTAKLSAASGAGTATIAMPASPAKSTTECDTLEGLVQTDAVSICAPGDVVTLTGLDVEAVVPIETCAGALNGIFVGEGTLKATNVVVDGASTSLDAYKGCQHGVAIDVGSIEPTEVAHAVLKDVTVFGYEKNGPTVSGVKSTMSVTASKVTGEGSSPWIAQNGIQVAFGARGTIKSTTISGNECSIPGPCSATNLENQGTGVLFYEAATGSSVTNSTFQENDIGAYFDSTSEETAPSPEVTFTKDVLTSNRYEGFVLEQGKALLSKDTINGSGDVGIDLVQSKTQTAPSESSATHTKVEDQAEAAIKVESDKSSEDKPGSFDFTDGTFSGDATVLDNESNNFEVVL